MVDATLQRQAHVQSVATPIADVVVELSEELGQQTTASIAGLKSVTGIARIGAGTRKPHADNEQRLRVGYQVWHLLALHLDKLQARTWFRTPNPDLGYQCPAVALGEGRLQAVAQSAEGFIHAS